MAQESQVFVSVPVEDEREFDAFDKDRGGPPVAQLPGDSRRVPMILAQKAQLKGAVRESVNPSLEFTLEHVSEFLALP